MFLYRLEQAMLQSFVAALYRFVFIARVVLVAKLDIADHPFHGRSFCHVFEGDCVKRYG